MVLDLLMLVAFEHRGLDDVAMQHVVNCAHQLALRSIIASAAILNPYHPAPILHTRRAEAVLYMCWLADELPQYGTFASIHS